MSTAIDFQLKNLHKPVYFTHGDDISRAEIFATILQQYTNAAVEFVSVTEGKNLEGVTHSGDYGHVGLFAKLLIRQNDTHKLYAIIIPAPKESLFIGSDDEGWQVKQDIGEAITAEYAALAGKAFTYETGWLCGSSMAKQEI